MKREIVTSTYVKMHSQQNSANELDQKEIDSLTEGLEGVLDKVSSLRSIDLKNTEPASIYKPIKREE